MSLSHLFAGYDEYKHQAISSNVSLKSNNVILLLTYQLDQMHDIEICYLYTLGSMKLNKLNMVYKYHVFVFRRLYILPYITPFQIAVTYFNYFYIMEMQRKTLVCT